MLIVVSILAALIYLVAVDGRHVGRDE